MQPSGFSFLFIFYLLLGICANPFVDDYGLQLKVIQKIAKYDAENITISQRCLVVYYIGSVPAEDSMDVIVNNVKLFVSAMQSHSETAKNRAFYIFRVVGGGENTLIKHLPLTSNNAAFMKCAPGSSDLFTHINTVAVLGDTIMSKFQSVVFLNEEARGPFEGRRNGEWLKAFTAVFETTPNIGMVGPLISCEIAPHVQTHVFAMRSSVALEVFSEFNPRKPAGRRNRAKHLEISFTTEILNMGYNITSLFYKRRFDKEVFGGQCISGEGNSMQYKSNPTSWCDIKPRDALFMKWGGPPLRIKGYYCQDTIESIRKATVGIALAEPYLDLVLPETVYGGRLHALHKEYDEEEWRDRTTQPLRAYPPVPVPAAQDQAAGASTSTVLALPAGKVAVPTLPPPPPVQKVCLLVRTALMHGRAASNSTRNVRMDLDLLIRCMYSVK